METKERKMREWRLGGQSKSNVYDLQKKCQEEPAGRQQWAEPRLEAVREGQVSQTGVTDFGP